MKKLVKVVVVELSMDVIKGFIVYCTNSKRLVFIPLLNLDVIWNFYWRIFVKDYLKLRKHLLDRKYIKDTSEGEVIQDEI